MIYINTIADFQRLSGPQQLDVLKTLRVKDRLEKWLWSLNDRKKQPKPPKPEGEPDGWKRCKNCIDSPGWVPEAEGRDDSFIHPSQIEKCVMNLWFCCNGFAEQKEDRVDPQLRMIFDLGHGAHHMLQSYGRAGAWGPGYQEEVEIDPEKTLPDGTPIQPLAAQYWLKGHIDAVHDNYYVPSVPGLGDVTIRIGHEYKTINDDGFKRISSSLKPKIEHRKQATLYSLVEDLPVMVYVYLNKNNCQFLDIPVPFDQGLWHEMYREKIQPVLHYTQLKQQPPWEITSARLNPSECKSCEFRKTVCKPPIAEK